MLSLCVLQLVDDALDFTSTACELGKPVAADLSLGLATAPVLYAAETVSYKVLYKHVSKINVL